jgi:hypothetical protein
MSKVFNAKRKEVTAQYEFLDGANTEMVIVSLSGNENKELAALQKADDITLGDFLEKQSRFMLQRNDKKVTEKIIKEQVGEGDILEFAKALREAIDEAKKEKGNA